MTSSDRSLPFVTLYIGHVAEITAQGRTIYFDELIVYIIFGFEKFHKLFPMDIGLISGRFPVRYGLSLIAGSYLTDLQVS